MSRAQSYSKIFAQTHFDNVGFTWKRVQLLVSFHDWVLFYMYLGMAYCFYVLELTNIFTIVCVWHLLSFQTCFAWWYISGFGGYINTATYPQGTQTAYPQYTYPTQQAGSPGQYNTYLQTQAATLSEYTQNSYPRQQTAPFSGNQPPPPYTECHPQPWCHTH